MNDKLNGLFIEFKLVKLLWDYYGLEYKPEINIKDIEFLGLKSIFNEDQLVLSLLEYWNLTEEETEILKLISIQEPEEINEKLMTDMYEPINWWFMDGVCLLPIHWFVSPEYKFNLRIPVLKYVPYFNKLIDEKYDEELECINGKCPVCLENVIDCDDTRCNKSNCKCYPEMLWDTKSVIFSCNYPVQALKSLLKTILKMMTMASSLKYYDNINTYIYPIEYLWFKIFDEIICLS